MSDVHFYSAYARTDITNRLSLSWKKLRLRKYMKMERLN